MTYHTPITPAAVPATRHDGWTPERQRTFLEGIADGETMESACRFVGLSVASAYALRRRASGAAFALGWRGANLLAREGLANRLLRHAVDGHVVTTTRSNGDVVEQHRFDHGLASRLLARLDRQAEESTAPAHAAAQAVAGEFDQFLDLVERNDGPARAGLFLVARTPIDTGADTAAPTDLEPIRALARADLYARGKAGLPEEVDTRDLDPARRADWTAEQWTRAEAAGLLRLAAPPAPQATPEPKPQPKPQPAGPAFGPQLPQLGVDDPLEPVWWDSIAEEWRTNFLPPDGFDGEEVGDWNGEGYERTLSDAETRVVDALTIATDTRVRAEEREERDAWFADLACAVAAAGFASGEAVVEGEDDADAPTGTDADASGTEPGSSDGAVGPAARACPDPLPGGAGPSGDAPRYPATTDTADPASAEEGPPVPH